jgi:hypothetical protein
MLLLDSADIIRWLVESLKSSGSIQFRYTNEFLSTLAWRIPHFHLFVESGSNGKRPPTSMFHLTLL